MRIQTFQIVNSDPSADILSPTNQFLSKYFVRNGLERVFDYNPDVFVAINHSKSEYRKFLKRGGNSRKAFLIRLEPKSVYPKQFKKRIEEMYELVITPGSNSDFLEGKDFVGWPYMLNANPAKPSQSEFRLNEFKSSIQPRVFDELANWMQRPKFMTMIAANKVSPRLNSNYRIRRLLAIQMESAKLEVWGGLWNDSLSVKANHRVRTALANLKSGVVPNPFSIYGGILKKYSNAVGEIENKFDVIQESKFSLVIENCDDYVSEKLFDAIVGGSVPIYIGPNLESVGLPSSIAVTGVRTAGEIKLVVESLSNDDVFALLQAGREFMLSNLFKDLWNADRVFQKLSETIISSADNRDS